MARPKAVTEYSACGRGNAVGLILRSSLGVSFILVYSFQLVDDSDVMIHCKNIRIWTDIYVEFSIL